MYTKQLASLAALVLCACADPARTARLEAPLLQMAAPKEPIEINMNLRIEHNIRVQVDRELEDMFEEDSNLF